MELSPVDFPDDIRIAPAATVIADKAVLTEILDKVRQLIILVVEALSLAIFNLVLLDNSSSKSPNLIFYWLQYSINKNRAKLRHEFPISVHPVGDVFLPGFLVIGVIVVLAVVIDLVGDAVKGLEAEVFDIDRKFPDVPNAVLCGDDLYREVAGIHIDVPDTVKQTFLTAVGEVHPVAVVGIALHFQTVDGQLLQGVVNEFQIGETGDAVPDGLGDFDVLHNLSLLVTLL